MHYFFIRVSIRLLICFFLNLDPRPLLSERINSQPTRLGVRASVFVGMATLYRIYRNIFYGFQKYYRFLYWYYLNDVLKFSILNI